MIVRDATPNDLVTPSRVALTDDDGFVAEMLYEDGELFIRVRPGVRTTSTAL